MKVFVIIPAAGLGTRMAGPGTKKKSAKTATVSKQFTEVGDAPILIHTLRKFAASYPVSDISGKITTRALASRIAVAWARAFAAMSRATVSGWATVRVSGSREGRVVGSVLMAGMLEPACDRSSQPLGDS